MGESMGQTERFTEEEREELLANPYTDSITPGDTIHFTLAFKEYAWKQKRKGKRTMDIFEAAGYRRELIPPAKMRSIMHRIKVEAESEEGLQEPRTKKKPARNLDKMQTKTAIRHLENEVEYLRLQMDFLKKLIELDMAEEQKR
jgi:hypothetical protein